MLSAMIITCRYFQYSEYTICDDVSFIGTHLKDPRDDPKFKIIFLIYILFLLCLHLNLLIPKESAHSHSQAIFGVKMFGILL